MTSLIKKPLFWTNVAAFTVTGLMVAGLAFAWTNPSAAPTVGNGALKVDSTTGKVGINLGASAPSDMFEVGGGYIKS